METRKQIQAEREVRIPSRGVLLEGALTVPERASGLVLFVHGSGSSRHSPRNQAVARTLQASGLATLLFDLLTAAEEEAEQETGFLRFDIDFLAGRLGDATAWTRQEQELQPLALGYFGASTGAAAALVAAADPGSAVRAVVSRGGRPDLAGPSLPSVRAPTLLIVGGADEPVISLNREAYRALRCEKELRLIPGATHLFSEPGTLDQAARMAADWFAQHFAQESA